MGRALRPGSRLNFICVWSISLDCPRKSTYAATFTRGFSSPPYSRPSHDRSIIRHVSPTDRSMEIFIEPPLDRTHLSCIAWACLRFIADRFYHAYSYILRGKGRRDKVARRAFNPFRSSTRERERERERERDVSMKRHFRSIDRSGEIGGLGFANFHRLTTSGINSLESSLPPLFPLCSFSFLFLLTKPRRRPESVFHRACNFRSLARSRVPIRIAFGFYAAKRGFPPCVSYLDTDSVRAAICGRAI